MTVSICPSVKSVIFSWLRITSDFRLILFKSTSGLLLRATFEHTYSDRRILKHFPAHILTRKHLFTLTTLSSFFKIEATTRPPMLVKKRESMRKICTRIGRDITWKKCNFKINIYRVIHNISLKVKA